MLLELLRTSNFMLRQIALWAVRGPPFYEHECQARIKRVLTRNERPRVRKSRASLGPEAIARISAFPNPRVPPPEAARPRRRPR
jgi:hypothetical protein